MTIYRLDPFHRLLQARALPVLCHIIREGQEATLPPLSWTLLLSGEIRGEATPGGNPRCELAVRAWADLLGVTMSSDIRLTEFRRLTGRAENFRGVHLLDLVLVCTVFGDRDELAA